MSTPRRLKPPLPRPTTARLPTRARPPSPPPRQPRVRQCWGGAQSSSPPPPGQLLPKRTPHIHRRSSHRSRRPPSRHVRDTRRVAVRRSARETRTTPLDKNAHNAHHEAMSTTSTPVMVTLVPLAPTRGEAAARRTWRVCAGILLTLAIAGSVAVVERLNLGRAEPTRAASATFPAVVVASEPAEVLEAYEIVEV